MYRAYGYLVGVVLLWSTNIIMVKAALPDIPPFALTSLRFAGAVIVFLLIARALGLPIVPLVDERAGLAVIGTAQIGLVTALTAAGLSYVSAGRATIVIYTMQIWALPLGYWIARDALNRARILGVLIASAGLAIFLSPWLVDWTDIRSITGYTTLVGTGVLWAVSSCFYRLRRWRTPPLTQILWQLCFSACLLGGISIVAEEPESFRFSPIVMSVLAFSWMAGAVLPYWWWAGALTLMPVSQAGQFATLVPLLVFLLSTWIFDEPLSFGVLASSLLILGGIAISAAASAKGPAGPSK